MNRDQARALVAQTFTFGFDKARFRNFTFNLLNHVDESKAQLWNVTYIKDAFKKYVNRYERLGTYTSPEDEKLDVLIVYLTADSTLERARTAIRNFVAHHLKRREDKDAALVAFVSPSEATWRFSYVKMEYAAAPMESGEVGVETRLTPARRFSYIVGQGESCHTAQARFLDLLGNTEQDPSLALIEEAFSVEAVTKEFFTKYAALFTEIKAALQDLISNEKALDAEFTKNKISPVEFAKKLMGQIVFLYFLQKKGWLGVEKAQDWGTGPHDFLRRLAKGEYGAYKNFFNDILEPLFYDTLAIDRGHEAWCGRFKCRIPFLNGGLFEPLGNYHWRKVDVTIPNQLFTNTKEFEGDIGTGVLDIFDRYNFTVNEAEPLEKEVAIDPEMLGKVFENLIEENRRKGLGAYYTPREIVHYMCQQCLIDYLDSALNKEDANVLRTDIETFVRLGDQGALYEAARLSGSTSYRLHLPKSIQAHARVIDEALARITICDPAVGSGAFPVGMMNEIVRARIALTPYFNETHERSPYRFKHDAIQNCLYGVDIDPGAVEIAKLRLWLSLVVDEENVKQIKPLPNLDYKIVTANSLLGIEKTLFNDALFQKLESLKTSYFDETDPRRKTTLKAEIGTIIEQLSEGQEVFDFEVHFSEVFHGDKGFNVLAANPPYLGHKGGQKRFFNEMKAKSLGRRFNNERMDLFYYFFHLSLDLAKRHGVVAFITTNYYVTADSAIKLRKDFHERATVLNLINFNELKIFESALGQHNMITVLRKGHDDTTPCQVSITSRTGFASPEILRSILLTRDPQTSYREVPQTSLFEGNMLYMTSVNAGSSASDSLDTLLDRLRKEPTRLGNVCTVGQGIVTGLDHISNKHLERLPRAGLVKGQGCYVLDQCEVERLSSGSDHIIKPWFKNSDISRYFTNTTNDEWLIHATVDSDLPNHKRIYQHLLSLKPAIESRNYDSGELSKASRLGKWWALSSARKDFDFTTPKIVSPQRSYRNTFAYNEVPWYASADVYYITQKDRSVSLKYVLALLNSKLYFVWLYFKGKRKGEMLELYQKPLSEIPLKRISATDQKVFISLVDRILAAKERDPDTDTSSIEREIDTHVYSLYGLTKKDIALIEASQPQ